MRRVGRIGRPKGEHLGRRHWSTSLFSSEGSRCDSSIRSCERRSTTICQRPSRPICTRVRPSCLRSSAPTLVRSRCTSSRRRRAATATSLRCSVRPRGRRSPAVRPTPPPGSCAGRSTSLQTWPIDHWCCSSWEMPNTRWATRLRRSSPGGGRDRNGPLIRARALTALAWTTHPNPPRQREQLPLYEWAAEEVRPHDRELALQLDAARLGALHAQPGSARQARSRSRPRRRPAGADRGGVLAAVFRRPQGARRRPGRGGRRSRGTGGDSIPPWSVRAVTRCGGRMSRSA